MISQLQALANNIRKVTLEMIHSSHASHIASAFSMVEILAVLYDKVMNISPDNVEDIDRDRFILSKGHGASAVYATLYLKGFLTENEISNYYQDGNNLSGHVSHKGVKGIEVSTGSLGHGVCIASGIAMAGKLNNQDYKTFCIVGDGECNEGCVWEMAQLATQQKLNNFVVIVDKNNMQAMGATSNIINSDRLCDKWISFGFHTISVDGHNIEQLLQAFESIADSDKPCCIIANTIKGKGVSFMENELIWHYRDPQGEKYEQAKKELNNEK